MWFFRIIHYVRLTHVWSYLFASLFPLIKAQAEITAANYQSQHKPAPLLCEGLWRAPFSLPPFGFLRGFSNEHRFLQVFPRIPPRPPQHSVSVRKSLNVRRERPERELPVASCVPPFRWCPPHIPSLILAKSLKAPTLVCLANIN